MDINEDGIASQLQYMYLTCNGDINYIRDSDILAIEITSKTKYGGPQSVKPMIYGYICS